MFETDGVRGFRCIRKYRQLVNTSESITVMLIVIRTERGNVIDGEMIYRSVDRIFH